MPEPRKIRSPTTIGWDMLRPVSLVIQAMFFVSYETGPAGSR